jgi:hypothetical protein
LNVLLLQKLCYFINSASRPKPSFCPVFVLADVNSLKEINWLAMTGTGIGGTGVKKIEENFMYLVVVVVVAQRGLNSIINHKAAKSLQ